MGSESSEKHGRIIAGIDIGTTKVCTLVARVDDVDNIDILGVGVSQSEGMKKGLVVDLDKVSHSIDRSVSKAEKMAKVVIERAYIGISGSHITSSGGHGVTTVSEPMRGVSQDDVRRAIEAARYIMLPPEKEIIDVIEQGYVVDGHTGIMAPIGMSGNRLEAYVQIITGVSAFLQNVTKSVMRLNIGVEGLILEPLASGEAALSADEKKIGVVLLDIGGGTTDLAVFKGGALCKTHILPIGGDHIDNDIAVGLSTSPKEAERLKIQFGSVVSDPEKDHEALEFMQLGFDEKAKAPRGLLTEIIHPRVWEILTMAAAEFSQDFAPESAPAGVALTGGGALLDGIVPLAEQAFGLRARLGYPLKVRTQYDKVSSPVYATAVGLIRCAARRMRIQEEMSRGQRMDPKNAFEMAKRYLKGLFR